MARRCSTFDLRLKCYGFEPGHGMNRSHQSLGKMKLKIGRLMSTSVTTSDSLIVVAKQTSNPRLHFYTIFKSA